MADRAIPVIQPEDYAAFQKLVPGLPSTHDVWNARQIAELRAAMRLGERLIEVVVFPDAFAEFLRQRQSDGSLATPEAFVVERALVVAPDAAGGPKR